MKTISFLILLIGITATSHGQLSPNKKAVLPVSPFAVGTSSSNMLFNSAFSLNNNINLRSNIGIPFPQCIQTEAASALFHPTSIQKLFRVKLEQEASKLKQERNLNDNIRNHDIMDFDVIQLRSDDLNGPLLARTAMRLTEDLLRQLQCETNATVSAQLDDFLKNIRLPSNVCAFDPNANCAGLAQYRTITGVCNNLQRPYEGSSQTAYARLTPAAYDDGLAAARSQSVFGGPLPSCREISLMMGSEPILDKTFNNLFVAYGQFFVHDITLATPVTDSGRTPITSCNCDSQDPSMCTVIDISVNDPAMAGQRCMSIPATTAAFADSTCSLGVKEQMNGNSHYIDLSVTYGSTKRTAASLRLGQGGLLKTAKRSWSKLDLPPGQREGKSCTDSTATEKCFAGGDSRLMENILLSGIQTQWVRAHNIFANGLAAIRPDWNNNDDILYEEAKKILSALHQRYLYEDWLPILISKRLAQHYVGDQGLFSQYDPKMPGVTLNEAVTGVLRLHTLARDILSRCRSNGQFIDQVLLRDVSAKCKLAYDAPNNGIDSILCGSLYDYGFAGDTNYAEELHHRLFEMNTKGSMKRNDIVAINICRAREHGIAGYNIYREYCGLRRADKFQDFADTMSLEAAQKLQTIYQHPDDVDLFVGANHENIVPGGLVGTVSSCIIGLQFKHLKYGDRFFYSHQGQFTEEQFSSIKKYSYNCFICHTTDIEKVALNAFRPPNDKTNPLGLCSQCPMLDLNPWGVTPTLSG